MSDLKKTVEIIFQGTDKLSSTVKSISKGIDGLAGGITTATDPLANLSDQVVILEGALATLAVAGLAVAVTQAGEFGDSFAEISTLIDIPAGKIDDFRQQVLDYGRDASSSYDDVNAAVYTAISAGVDYADSLDLLRISEQLSIGGRADLEASTKLLASTLNAYGESAEFAEHYSDILFQTVKLGQTTIPELAQSLSKVTGIAAGAGVPFETLASAIAAVTASGAPTTEAITGIKAALSNIIKPSAEAAELAAELGLSFDATALQSRGFEGVLQDVYTATGGNVSEMAKLFGSIEAFNSVLILAIDSLGKFAGALDAVDDATGSTQAAYDKMVNNFALTNQRFINNMTATLVDIGAPLLDEYGEIASALGDIFKGVSIGIDAGAFDSVYEYLETAGSSLAEYFRGIAEVLPEALEGVDFDGLLDALDGLGVNIKKVFKALFGDLDLTNADDLEKAIQKIVNGVTAITNVTSGIVGAWEPFAKAVGAAIDKFTESDASVQKFVGTITGFGKALNTIADNTGIVTGSLDTIGKSFAALTAIKFVGMAGGIGVVTAALAPLALGGALGIGVAALAMYISDKLTPAIKDIPESTELTLVLDDGNVLDVLTGIIHDAEGRVISVPVHADDTAFTADTTNAQVKELLETGASTAEINYAITGDTAELETYLKDAGVLITKEMAETAAAVETELVEIGGKMVEVEIVPPPKWAIKQIQKDIEEKIPSQKEIEITLQGEIDKELAIIATSAETIQTSMEWTARLDIAEVEAQAKILESAFGSIDSTMQSAGETISSLFGLLAGDIDISAMWAIERQIRIENELREKTFELQKDLTEAQIKYMNAKTAALESGELNLTVSADGLAPHLEMIWHEVLEYCQVRASAEGAELLI